MRKFMGLPLGLLLIVGFLLGGLGACSSDGAYVDYDSNRAPHPHNMGGGGPGSKH
jgi:hypothetical protein